jgi:hypothetical protein
VSLRPTAARTAAALLSMAALLLCASPATAAQYLAEARYDGVGESRSAATAVAAGVEGPFGSAIAQAGRLGTLRTLAESRTALGLYSASAEVEDMFRIVGPGGGTVGLVVNLVGELSGLRDYTVGAGFVVSQGGELFDDGVQVSDANPGGRGAFQLLRTLQVAPNLDFVFNARVFAESEAGRAVATMRPPRLSIAPELAGLYTLVRVSGEPVEPGAVPEPSTWGVMILGFGLTGGVLRRRRTARPFAERPDHAPRRTTSCNPAAHQA